MRRSLIRFVIILFTLSIPIPGIAGQQAPAPQGSRPPQVGSDLSPAEIQRLFDAYALMQAQDALRLDDEQYGRFVTAMKGLLDVRRRHQQERARQLRELNRLSGPDAAQDEAALVAALDQLATLEAKATAELREAYGRLGGVLSPRQRARFRLFEENMERRKIDLLMRARQANRTRRQPGS